MVRAGTLRHRVTIQSVGTAQDDAGQPTEVWSDVATVWGRVRDIRGHDFIEAQQAPGGEITTEVTIRYRDDITRQHRLIAIGRTLEIRAVIEPTGRGEEFRLMCREAT